MAFETNVFLLSKAKAEQLKAMPETPSELQPGPAPSPGTEPEPGPGPRLGPDPEPIPPASETTLRLSGTVPSEVWNRIGPLIPLGVSDGSLVEPGLVDQAWDFVRRNTTPSARLEGARRKDRWEYPEAVVRETIVNALVHRDYSIAGTDVMLSIFSDRLEVTSPGPLPNTVTPEGMMSGLRYARNQTLVNVMRDYGYVDARGMGVRNKIIPGMRAHNGTDPEFIEEEHRFTVRLWHNLA